MLNNKVISETIEKINRGQEFYNSLNYDDYYFYPAKKGLTKAGNELKLGFSCYGLKYYFMTGKWDELNSAYQMNWIDSINNFQTKNSKFPKNFYIDFKYLYYLNKFNLVQSTKNQVKSIFNLIGLKNYDLFEDFERKSVNAETKQAVSTLYQVNNKNKYLVENEFLNSNDLINYLNNLDWTRPWSSGAQFSSICVYAKTQNNYDIDVLKQFCDSIVDKNSGFYFKGQPQSTREILNGAMKIISGLDWIDYEIHYPKKIIDLCLKNKPVFEGCDFVDFVYVLFKCVKQTNYKKIEVTELMKSILVDIDKLYFPEDGGYSYFQNKSQTHYYGVEITKGLKVPDIHATLLCNWANILILDTLEVEHGFNILKP